MKKIALTLALLPATAFAHLDHSPHIHQFELVGLSLIVVAVLAAVSRLCLKR